MPSLDDYFKWRTIIWEEYKEKSSIEWKFSYSIWAALLGVASVIVANKIKIKELLSRAFPYLNPVLVIVFIAFLSHLIILSWVQYRLRSYRKELKHIDDTIRKNLNMGTSGPSGNELNSKQAGKWIGKIAPFIQLIITTILCFLLCYVMFY